MKRLVVTCLLSLVSMLVSPLVASAVPSTGAARLTAIDASGVQARILFLDTGSPQNGLVVSGFATGLDPTQLYISLVYDAGSVPGGPTACVPTGNPPITATQMAVGFWTVAENGTGTLFAIKSGDSYFPLSDIGTMSVRIVLGPPPEGFVLESCGRVGQRRQ
jgi:hypothetical protein